MEKNGRPFQENKLLIDSPIHLPSFHLFKGIEKMRFKNLSNLIPLSYYKAHSINIIFNDTLDQFGTPLEQRFCRAEIMDMGIPFVCNAGVGDTDTFVQKYRAGHVIKNLIESEYLSTVNEIDLDHFERNKLRLGAIDYASLEEGVRRYSIVYKQCIENGN